MSYKMVIRQIAEKGVLVKKTMLFLLMLPCALFAETFYVCASSGADGQPGTQKQPWKTISFAAEKVQAGGTVIVLPGNYPEAVVVTASGTETASVVFRAEPPRQAKVQSFEIKADYITIEGFDISNDVKNDWHGFGISCGQAHLETARTGGRILNNYIHDMEGTAVFSGKNALVKNNLMKNITRGVFANSGTLVESNEVDTLVPVMEEKNGELKPKKTQYNFFCGDDITFRGNYLHGAPEEYLIKGMGVCFFASWDDWIFGPSHRILIENNRGFNATHASEPTADKLKQSSHITYRGNLFVNTVFVGIFPREWSHITVENNTLINCGAYPIWFTRKRQAEHSVVRNNLVVAIDRERTVEKYGWKKPMEGVVAPTYKDPTATLKLCDNNMMWGYKSRNYGPNDFVAEPQFIDPANGDFRLKPGSPGIDAGATIEEIKTDLLGTPRPQGKAFDIGAYETVQ